MSEDAAREEGIQCAAWASGPGGSPSGRRGASSLPLLLLCNISISESESPLIESDQSPVCTPPPPAPSSFMNSIDALLVLEEAAGTCCRIASGFDLASPPRCAPTAPTPYAPPCVCELAGALYLLLSIHTHDHHIPCSCQRAARRIVSAAPHSAHARAPRSRTSYQGTLVSAVAHALASGIRESHRLHHKHPLAATMRLVAVPSACHTAYLSALTAGACGHTRRRPRVYKSYRLQARAVALPGSG